MPPSDPDLRNELEHLGYVLATMLPEWCPYGVGGFSDVKSGEIIVQFFDAFRSYAEMQHVHQLITDEMPIWMHISLLVKQSWGQQRWR